MPRSNEDALVQREMPASIQPIFDALFNELVLMHFRWKHYQQLFVTPGKKRIDLLNESAGSFFHDLQNLLTNYIQLTLSNLTSKRRDVLSLWQLQRRLEQHAGEADKELVHGCKTLLTELHVSSGAITTARNSRIAHLSLNFALQAAALPIVTRGDIERALEQVRRYMNKVEHHYRGNETAYTACSSIGNADDLAQCLKSGARYEQLVHEQKISYDDHFQSPWKDA